MDVMKLSSMLVPAAALLLLGSAKVAPPNYPACADAVDPPECIVDLARQERSAGAADLLEAVLRLGMVDLALQESSRLKRLARAEVRSAGWFESAMHASDRAEPRGRDIEAAIVLLAASRNLEDPFADPRVAKVVVDRSLASTWALILWREVLEGGSPPDVAVRVPGLAALWLAASKDASPDDALLHEIAGTLAFFEDLEPVLEPWFLARAADPSLSPDAKAQLASQLARYFGRVEVARKLLDSGGARATHYNIDGMRAGFAEVTLRAGRDADALKVFVDRLLGDLPGDSAFGHFEGFDRDLLERVGAREELRLLAREYEKLAEGATEQYQITDWFGAASDCYRRTGDIEAARTLARRSLPKDLSGYEKGSFNSAAATGARALYRAGLVDEAIATGYLPGFERYVDAPLAGELSDPQWVLDEERRDSGPPFMLLHALRSKDSGDRERAYAAFRRKCPLDANPLCEPDFLAWTAVLAASLGDADGMRDYFAAKLRAVSDSKERRFWVFETANQWEHARELLLKR